MKAIELQSIREALEVFKANLADLANDQTQSAAQEALTSAESAASKLKHDDPGKTPEQLIDDRFEADRAVSIAQLRLSRAKSEAISQRSAVSGALNEPADNVVNALRESAPLIKSKFIADVKNILGEDFVRLKGELENIAYHRGERMHSAARNIEKSKGMPHHIDSILAALPLLEINRQAF